MPDVDDQLAELRDELHGTVPVPGLEVVTERYRQRRGRRRMQIGAVAAVLLVSGLVPILRQFDAVPPATPPPSTDTEPMPPTGPEVPGLRTVVDVQFADDGSGYALWAGCGDAPLTERLPPPCELTVLAGTDLEHWTEVGPVPVPERTDVSTLGSLFVLGPNELVVDWAALDAPGSGGARVHSVDGGRTWKQVPMPATVTDTVPAIPEGARLTSSCGLLPGAFQPCRDSAIIVTRPGSGAPAVLAEPPPLVDTMPGALPTADGHWWVAGRQQDTRALAVAVSTDEGRTWRTGSLDIELPQGAWVSVTSQDGSLYAAVAGDGQPLADPFRLRAIFRSDDDGRTWRRTWTVPAGTEVQLVGDLVPATDGSVRLYENPRTYVFTDGGRTMNLDSQELPGPVRRTMTGYVATGLDTFQFSSDGLRWREYKLPVG